MIFVYLGSNISHLEDTEKNITGIELLITHQSFPLREKRQYTVEILYRVLPYWDSIR